MKLKTIILIAFIVCIIFPISSYAVTEQENAKMKVTPVTSHNFEGLWLRGFDITGKNINNAGTKETISSTHNNLGYHIFLNVNGKNGEMNGKYTLGKEKMKHMHYTEVKNDTVQNIDGIDLLVKTKFINNGEQLKITYTLKNTTNELATISLGTSADVEIDGDDKATIEKMNNGEKVRLYTKEGKTKKDVQFVFYGKNTKEVTNIDNLWIGGWSDYYLQHIFEDNPNTNKIENCDSAFTFSWVNRKIKPNETQNYSVIMEVGKENTPQIKIKQENNKKLYYKNVKFGGTVIDKDLKDTITIHYTVDGKEFTLAPINTIGSSKDFSIDLSKLNLTIANPHKLTVWATDSTNAKSNVEERTFTVTSLKNPKLILSEEGWTKNNVTFKITDEENKEYIDKYQYRINNGEWNDIKKDTEKEITENGTNKIEIRIVGTNKNDYSDIITNYAKIDKLSPETTAPTFTKTINTITINAEQTDKHSGINNEKTLYAIKKGTTWSDFQTSNTFTNLADNTTYIIKTKATDNVGNTSESKEITVTTDKTKLGKPNIISENNFINKCANFKLNSENKGSSIKYQFKINNGNWQEIAKDTTYTITNIKQGEITIYARAVDNEGRYSDITTKKVTVSIKEDIQENKPNEDTTIADENIVDETIPDGEDTIIDETTPIINNLENNESTEIDNTTANIKIPKTGENDFILVIIVFFVVMAVQSYWKLKHIK